jgi:hypothetical protein
MASQHIINVTAAAIFLPVIKNFQIAELTAERSCPCVCNETAEQPQRPQRRSLPTRKRDAEDRSFKRLNPGFFYVRSDLIALTSVCARSTTAAGNPSVVSSLGLTTLTRGAPHGRERLA